MPNAADDRLLKLTKRQISKEYNDALLEAVRKSREFLQRAQAVHDGKVQPPAALTTDKQIQAWKEGYLRRAAEKVGVVSHMQSEMGAAGIRTRKRIEDTMITVYRRNQQNVNALLDSTLPTDATAETRERIRALLYGEGRMSAFTKISLDHLGTGKNPARRLQNELAAGLRRGEGQEQLLARIRKVTGMELDDAKRVLRTEMTHVEGLAQQQAAMDHYLATGVKPMKRWHCTFHNSRDSHMSMHGQTVPVDQPFLLPSGGEIMYPGDSNAGPSEVCNCQCWMEILSGENMLQNGFENDIMIPQGRGNVSIFSPIERRNTAKGNPNAILQFGRPLNRRQSSILAQLPSFNSSVELPRNSVNLKDLAALTAITGDEFALFTRSSSRLIIRGNSTQVDVGLERAQQLAEAGYRWSGHTHPGFEELVLIESDGDLAVLAAFKQDRSCIVNSKGQFYTFEKGE